MRGIGKEDVRNVGDKQIVKDCRNVVRDLCLFLQNNGRGRLLKD